MRAERLGRPAGAGRPGREPAERKRPAETPTGRLADMPSAARGEGRTRSVLVWDLPTRLFHWSLVAAVAAALGTGFLARDPWLGVHMTAGYVVLGLLSFRVIWGFFGSEHSRITSFAYAPRRVIEHLRGLMLLRPPPYLGHNPAGAVMIFALFAVLAALVVTGLMELAGEEKQGPLAGVVSYALGNGAKPVHWILASILLAMIALHLAGVLVGTWLLKEPLIRAMVTGRKPLPANAPLPRPRPARPVMAASWLALTVVSAAAAIALLSRLPPVGIPHLPPNKLMLSECGDCHHPFHPSLLPRASWARLMAHLDNHFGEDASLPAAKRDKIAAYLERYAAGAWDTEAARRFAVVSPTDPLRITATPYWRRKHARIDPAVFAGKAVRSRSNCIACHKDADSGRFDDQAIAIPKETAP
jgi:cytochrome b